MATISVDRTKYEFLKSQADAYERLIHIAQATNEVTPPTRSRSEVLKAFKETGKYSKAFLASLSRGLKNSSYFIDK